MTLTDKWNPNGSVKSKAAEKIVVKLDTPEEKAIATLNEINAFFAENNRAPLLERKNLREYELATKLQHMRHNQHKFPALALHDTYQLLVKNTPSLFAKPHSSQLNLSMQPAESDESKDS